MNNRLDNWPKYFVSYCVMDMDAGANPLGHSCLIFSSQFNQFAPVRVINSFGYYSQPNSSTNPVIIFIKRMLGLNVDLQDSHGVLKQEDLRYLEGGGLKATSFQVSKLQFDTTIEYIKGNIEQEQQAINEANMALDQIHQKKTGETRLLHENELARREGRPSRLNRFHLTIDKQFSSTDSYTCKTRAVDILNHAGAIDDPVASTLKGQGFSYAFPRCSSVDLFQLQTVSCGSRHLSSNGLFYNHYWNKNKLYWATPVIEFHQELNEELKQHLAYSYKKLNAIFLKKEQLGQKLYQAKQAAQMKWQKFQFESLIEQLEKTSYQFTNIEHNLNSVYLNQNIQNLDKFMNYCHYVMNTPYQNGFFKRLVEHYLSNLMLGLMATIGMVFFVTPSSLFLPIACTVTIMGLAYHSYCFYQKEQKVNQIQQDYLELKQSFEQETIDLSGLFHEEHEPLSNYSI